MVSLAPAGTPRPIIDKINRTMRVALDDPEVKKRVSTDGAEAASSTPDEYGAIIERDLIRWGDLIRKLDLKVE
jgi:tripartite-type tricarboxylate transporter receptor subunit TctC